MADERSLNMERKCKNRFSGLELFVVLLRTLYTDVLVLVSLLSIERSFSFMTQ